MKKEIGRLTTARENNVGQMELVKTEKFAGLDIDFYRSGDDVFMTRKQIGEALGYKNAQKAMDNIHARNKVRLDEFSVTLKLTGTDGKSYDTHLYNEKGIYEIMRKSNQPKADEFYDFVYDIIEGLRKGELQIKAVPQNYVEALRALADAEEEKQMLSNEVVGLNHAIGEMKPKVEYLDTILSSTDSLNITQIAKDYGLTGQELNKILHNERVQYKVGGQWVLYQQHAQKGYTSTHTHLYDKSDGTQGSSVQTKWTQKGRLLIHDILTSLGYVANMDKEEQQ